MLHLWSVEKTIDLLIMTVCIHDKETEYHVSLSTRDIYNWNIHLYILYCFEILIISVFYSSSKDREPVEGPCGEWRLQRDFNVPG